MISLGRSEYVSVINSSDERGLVYFPYKITGGGRAPIHCGEKQVALSMVSGYPSIHAGPGENQPEEGRISFELELSAFLVLRPSDLNRNLSHQFSGSQVFSHNHQPS